MLLNILQCTVAAPTKKNYPAQMFIVPRFIKTNHVDLPSFTKKLVNYLIQHEIGKAGFKRLADSLFGINKPGCTPHHFDSILKFYFQDWLIWCTYYQAVVTYFNPCAFPLSLQRR